MTPDARGRRRELHTAVGNAGAIAAGIYKIDADGANPVALAKSGKTGSDFGRINSEPDWQPR